MAYATSNPPALLVQRVGASAGAIWWYTSTDAATAVRVVDYITDGLDLGMKVGDLVISLDNDASPVAIQLHVVSAVDSGGADLSDGVAVTATNTD